MKITLEQVVLDLVGPVWYRVIHVCLFVSVFSIVFYVVGIVDYSILGWFYWYMPEVFLISVIFFGFFNALFSKNTAKFNQFLQTLIYGWLLYGVLLLFGYLLSPDDAVYVHHCQLVLGPEGTAFKLVIIVFYCVILGVLHLDSWCNQYKAVELPFFISLLFWTFLLVPSCFNFFFLFLLMEMITLIVVLGLIIYLIFFSTKTVLAVLQFFIFNLFISIFYLLGVGLLLFLLIPQQAATLSFVNLLFTYDVLYVYGDNVLYPFVAFLKLIVSFWVLTFSFKLTLAPVSVWIVNVYTQIPWLFLLILMTAYKIVYLVLFLKLFVAVLNFIPSLAVFWVQICWCFVLSSLFMGCLAYRTQDIKTLLAYTTISQLGFSLSGVIVQNTEALKMSLLYFLMYCFQLIVVFLILMFVRAQYNLTNLNQLYLLKYYNPLYCYVLVCIFFSFAGVPPLSGFFLKYFLFLYIYSSGFFIIAVLGLFASFFMALVYFQVILQLLWKKDKEALSLKVEHTKNVVKDGEDTNLVMFLLWVFVGFVICATVFFWWMANNGLLYCSYILECL